MKAKGSRSTLFFILAFIFLAIMALLSSLDGSFLFIFGGIGFTFLFFAFWTKLKASKSERGSSFNPYQQRPSSTNPASSFLDDLEKSFGQQKNQTTSSQNQKKLIAIILLTGAFVFILTVFTVIFSIMGDQGPSEDFLFAKAEQFREGQRFDSSDYYYNKILEQNPDHVEAINGYAITLINRNKDNEALKELDRALEIDPYFVYAKYNKALIYYNQQNYKQAIKESLELANESPEYTPAIQMAGDSYYSQQRYDSAIYYYENVYDQGVRSATLCHLMAFIYDTKGDQKKAITLYEEALTYDNSIISIHKRLGELLPGKEGDQHRAKN